MFVWIVLAVLVVLLLLLVPRLVREGRAETAAPRVPPVVPARLLAGANRTWVVFTTPYCATAGSVEAHLRAHDPGARLIEIDATNEPYLAAAFDIRHAPTVLLADAAGRVRTRLVGADAVEAYVRNPK
jgi:uncharacterized membrane protein